jgi:hypothetical protein
MFLTCFSYFICYFLILVFLRNRYLLILSRPFLAIQESDFSSRFSYLWHYKVVCRTCTPKFQAQHAGFLEVRCICLLPKVSGANVRWANTNHTFLTHKNPWTDTSLRDISPTKLRSTALDEIPKGCPTHELGWLSSSLRFA